MDLSVAQKLNLEVQRQHPLVATSGFSTLQEYVGYLIHRKAYEEAARLSSGKRVLDWGCNNGYGIEILQSLGCASISGLDVSAKAIEAARASLGTHVELLVYDNQTVLPAEEYEVVTSFQCIEHVADYDSYLAGIRQVLRPGGLAILTTPNAAIRIDPGMKPWNEFHVREFRPEELHALLSPYFSSVAVRGLFAIEKLHKVEVTRCTRARRAARGVSLIGILRKLCPARIRRFVRARTVNGSAPDLSYSTADLYYSDSELEACLDLIAVCRK
jgi:2-polyprenyl-3-methyl-5-hydroxy-6-metoxy-1,4-benzoquinol methylase